MKTYILLISFAALFCDVRSEQNPSVNMTIYYETLCPDSIRYILLQVRPAYDTFGSDLVLDFKPFGFASFTGSEDSWEFTCQHGEKECIGNMNHACLINLVPEQKDLVPLIFCMSNYYPSALESVELCLFELNSPTSMMEFQQCMTEDGGNLLHDYGVETMNLIPKPYEVPWTLFNGEFVEEDWTASWKDLEGVLCNKYLAGHPACT